MDYLVTTEAEHRKKSKKVIDAYRKNTAIVSEDFVHDSIQQNQLAPNTKYLIGTLKRS